MPAHLHEIKCGISSRDIMQLRRSLINVKTTSFISEVLFVASFCDSNSSMIDFGMVLVEHFKASFYSFLSSRCLGQ